MTYLPALLPRRPLEVATLVASNVGDPTPEPPMPLSLSDDEYNAVQAAAAPIHPMQRDAFLKALAVELERHPVVGPGVAFRAAAALQKTFVVAAHSETSHTAEPRHLGARQTAR
jgi:hypothetical protein